AILNKEPDILAILYLAAFLPRRPIPNFFNNLLIPMTFGLTAFALSHLQVQNNPGGVTEFHLWENIAFLANPASYVSFFHPIAPYIFMPRGYNVLILALIVWACFYRW